jgi:hypothetical protein
VDGLIAAQSNGICDVDVIAKATRPSGFRGVFVIASVQFWLIGQDACRLKIVAAKREEGPERFANFRCPAIIHHLNYIAISIS